jgi:hypothetical protein
MESSTPSREYEEQRLGQQQRNRKRARLLSLSAGLLLILIVLMQVVPGLKGSVRADWLVVIAFLGMMCVYLGGRAWRWQRMQARLAPEVLSKDQRAPVLYLRSFSADRRAGGYERRVGGSLSKLGPVVAAGRPEEKLPATTYIARGYLANDRWQDRVVDLMRRAQLVVLQVGTSEALTWELTQVVRLVRPDQLLVCLGRNRVRWLRGGDDAKSRYRQFREQYGRLFPKGLPAEMQGSVFITFGPDWTPIPSREVNGKVGDYLSWVLQGLHRRLTRFRFAS